jgi:hypothetical protein
MPSAIPRGVETKAAGGGGGGSAPPAKPSSAPFRAPRAADVCVSRVVDIEENVWSPILGLKGKIDASVTVLVKRRQADIRNFSVRTHSNSNNNNSNNSSTNINNSNNSSTNSNNSNNSNSSSAQPEARSFWSTVAGAAPACTPRLLRSASAPDQASFSLSHNNNNNNINNNMPSRLMTRAATTATAATAATTAAANARQSYAPVTAVTMPLELKTGKHKSVFHRSQLALYTLLMSDRYDCDVTSGLLCYLQIACKDPEPECTVVEAARPELRALIIQRNRLAVFLSAPTLAASIPPAHDASRGLCETCFVGQACAEYRRAYRADPHESELELDPELSALFERRARHLGASHAAYLRHWHELVHLEMSEVEASKKEIWTVPAEEREAQGKCLAGMAVVAAVHTPEGGTYFTFRRAAAAGAGQSYAGAQPPPLSAALLRSKLTEGDMVVLSALNTAPGMQRDCVWE